MTADDARVDAVRAAMPAPMGLQESEAAVAATTEGASA